jgi:CRP-like cAMP-binding protein
MYDLHSELVKSINRVLCNRVRLLYGMTEDASSLSLQERLGRALHRLAYSNGDWSEEGRINLDISHENLGRMLGASRQSVNKELKALERDGCIAIHYGKLSIIDLGQLQQRFDILLGQEQIAPDRQPGSDR